MSKLTHTPGCRQKVLEFLSAQKHPANAEAVADGVGITHKAASLQLSRLAKARSIRRDSAGKYMAKDAKAVSTPRTSVSSASAIPDEIMTKLAELQQVRSDVDNKISALETSLQLLGYRPRNTRGPITDRQWKAIGRKVNK